MVPCSATRRAGNAVDTASRSRTTRNEPTLASASVQRWTVVVFGRARGGDWTADMSLPMDRLTGVKSVDTDPPANRAPDFHLGWCLFRQAVREDQRCEDAI